MFPTPIESLLANRRQFSFSKKFQLVENRWLPYSSNGGKTYKVDFLVHLDSTDRAYTVSKKQFKRIITDVFYENFIDISSFSGALIIGKHIGKLSYLFPSDAHISTTYKSPMFLEIKANFERILERKADEITSLFLDNNTEKNQRYCNSYRDKVLQKLKESETYLVIFNQPSSEELIQIRDDLLNFRGTGNPGLRILFIHITPFSYPKLNLRIYSKPNL